MTKEQVKLIKKALKNNGYNYRTTFHENIGEFKVHLGVHCSEWNATEDACNVLRIFTKNGLRTPFTIEHKKYYYTGYGRYFYQTNIVFN